MRLDTDRITELLNQWSLSDGSEGRDVFALVYDELKRIATGYLHREHDAHALQATGIVHEAYLRLSDQTGFQWRSREHFFAFASRLMRRILVDEARCRKRSKRGGGVVHLTPTDAADSTADEPDPDVLAVDEALTELAQLDPDKAMLVELRFFGGLTLEETASALGVSLSSVNRQWRLARLWLAERLRPVR